MASSKDLASQVGAAPEATSEEIQQRSRNNPEELNTKRKKVAIFASGQGSIAESLYTAALNHPKEIQITHIICDQPNPEIAKRFSQYEQKLTIIEKKGTKAEHESAIDKVLQRDNVEWIFLAGYMRLLSADFIQKYPKKIINIHPSKLPLFTGLRAYERTFESDETEGGVSIHYVDQGIDTGPLIKQVTFEKKENDTLEEFIERGKSLEKQVYPKVFRQLLLES